MKALFLLAILIAGAVCRPRSSRRINDTKAEKVYSRTELMGLPKTELVKMLMGQPDAVYWWVFPKADCGYDDVPGNCGGKSVDECKQQCLATQGCGGFNYPHGVLKKTDCLAHKAFESSVDLYVVQDHPQPPPPPPTRNFPPIWPMPASFTNGTTTVTVQASQFTFSGTQSRDLSAAFDRYKSLFFPHRETASSAGLTGVTVTVTNVSGVLQLETDESYVLDVPTSGVVTLKAQTVFGAMHGLETLSQLIAFNFDTQGYEIRYAPWHIDDKPRFKHREVLVDSSRHFEPVWTLKALIDSLTYAKINTIHWHLVDSQSFPFDSPSFPKLGQKGAYSDQERYSVHDLEDVVEYARARGVRVMVEIDNPGHAASWCKGYPEVCPSPQCTEPLNPATNATFDLIDGMFRDLTGGKRGAGIFPDNMFHLGGDEVNTRCWTSNAAISRWMQDNNFTADGAYEYFVKRAQAIAHDQGRDVVGWEEIWNHFGTRLDKSTIIHQWLPGSKIAQAATAAGYRVLWSTDGVWYLDGLQTTWQTMYIQEPCTNIPDNLCDTLILGGGGEMWGETVDTSDIQQTIWPRLGAIAERLWSPRGINDADAAHSRFAAFRCLLNRRAVAAAPTNNAQARQPPPGPGGCYEQ